jgi:uridine kinase
MTSMPGMIRVTFDGREPLQVPVHTRLAELPGVRAGAGMLAYLGALVNNDIVALSYPLEVDCQVELLTMRHPHGWRIYRNSVAFLIAKAVHELFPDARFAVEHSLGSGLYCAFSLQDLPDCSAEQLALLERHVRELIRRDLPIERRKIAFADALRQFDEQRQPDKYNLLRFHNPPKVTVYSCDGFTDLAHGVLADRTGALSHFKLLSYPPGFVIQFPERENAPEIGPFEPQPHLFAIFQEQEEWGRILGLRTVGDLNRAIAEREVGDLIRMAEAFHEKKIASLADHIAQHRERIRWVLIAGPSSSGKTTFAKRLSVELRVNGLRPVAISVDDYFVDRAQTPLDENGAYDFEHVETVDLTLFNEHLAALDRGVEVALPSFNFEKGVRESRGKRLRIESDQIVIIEGIHCLNPRLSEALPADRKFRIYISALTQLNLDNHNRVATTDVRLVRRLVRDNMFRGNNALTTLGLWSNVRRGEKRWIFPFQQEADAAFNSSLDYELSVLKPLVEPLLREVKPNHTQYAEARRLTSTLDSFLTLSDAAVPANSILREFIGRSDFRYD